jgi:hypothetical protein
MLNTAASLSPSTNIIDMKWALLRQYHHQEAINA